MAPKKQPVPTGKGQRRQRIAKRPVRQVTQTNLPRPQEAISLFFLAAAKVVGQVRLPSFAGVNVVIDIMLLAGIVGAIIPTLERVVGTRAPDLVVPITISSVVTWIGVVLWCIFYTVQRAPRGRE